MRPELVTALKEWKSELTGKLEAIDYLLKLYEDDLPPPVKKLNMLESVCKEFQCTHEDIYIAKAQIVI